MLSTLGLISPVSVHGVWYSFRSVTQSEKNKKNLLKDESLCYATIQEGTSMDSGGAFTPTRFTHGAAYTMEPSSNQLDLCHISSSEFVVVSLSCTHLHIVSSDSCTA